MGHLRGVLAIPAASPRHAGAASPERDEDRAGVPRQHGPIATPKGVPMTAPPAVTRILVVANRTASTPDLLEEIGRRRDAGTFTLVVPPGHGNDAVDDWTPQEASALLHRSCFSDVAVL